MDSSRVELNNKTKQNLTKPTKLNKTPKFLLLHNKTTKYFVPSQQNSKTAKQQNNKTTKYFVSSQQNNKIFCSFTTKQQNSKIAKQQNNKIFCSFVVLLFCCFAVSQHNILLVYWLPLSTPGPDSFGPNWYFIHCFNQYSAFLGFNTHIWHIWSKTSTQHNKPKSFQPSKASQTFQYFEK